MHLIEILECTYFILLVYSVCFVIFDRFPT